MWKKILILSLSVAVFLFLMAPFTPADAGEKSKRMNWRVAGSIVDFKTYTGAEDQILLLLKAVGPPGRADLTISGYTGDLIFPPRDGCTFEVPLDGDSLVAVFDDLSMLFAVLSDDESAESYACVNPGQGTIIKIDMKITGGTGRFEGAKGYFTANAVSFSRYLDGTTALGAENGKFIGKIEFGD